MSRTNCCTYTTLPPLPTLPMGQGQPFNPTPKLQRLWTVPELGEYLHIGERSIYKAISEGRLIASWVGRQHLVSESNLAAFVKLQESDSSWHQKARETAKEAN